MKEEEVEQIENEKLFESISSFQNDFTQRDFEGTVMENRKQEKIAAKEKVEMLKEAYRDPFDLQFVKIETKERLEKARQYTAPISNTPSQLREEEPSSNKDINSEPFDSFGDALNLQPIQI